MSFNIFLNKKKKSEVSKLSDSSNIYDIIDSISCITDLNNRNSTDYFFNQSDLNKVAFFYPLLKDYKYCDKTYYYFNKVNNLWIAEDDECSILTRICDYTSNILEPEKKYVFEILYESKKTLIEHKAGKDAIDNIETVIDEFNKFIEKEIKSHQTIKFAESIIKFIKKNITDPEFVTKLNVGNQHLLPLKKQNLDLKTLKMSHRMTNQYFTQCVNISDINNISVNDDEYKKIDKFFMDIASGYEPKKQFLQKIFGYFLSGSVKGRCFFIFYGKGKNGKTACISLIEHLLNKFSVSLEDSIIVKRGKKNAGQASPELDAISRGERLGVISELDDSEQLNEVQIKRITGGDTQNARGLFSKKQKNFTSEIKLLALTNEKPKFEKNDAIIDRLIFINFGSRFVDNPTKKNEYKIDNTIIDEIKTYYMNYFLLWCAVGAKKWYDEGENIISIPNDEVLQQENSDYVNENDTVGSFIKAKMRDSKDETVKCSTIHNEYNDYCDEKGAKRIQKSKLIEKLKDKYNVKQIKGIEHYINVTLNIDDNNDVDDYGLDN
jgi:P4 family phage/plasmid primase-like protien